MGLLTGERPTEQNNTLGYDIMHFKSRRHNLHNTQIIEQCFDDHT
jgi:hypothetical protein